MSVFLCVMEWHTEKVVWGSLPGPKWWCSYPRNLCPQYVLRFENWSKLNVLWHFLLFEMWSKTFLLHQYGTIPICYLCLQTRFYASSDEPWWTKCVMSACHQSTVLCLPSLVQWEQLEAPSFIMVSVHSAVHLIKVFALPTLQKMMACCISRLICHYFVTHTLFDSHEQNVSLWNDWC